MMELRRRRIGFETCWRSCWNYLKLLERKILLGTNMALMAYLGYAGTCRNTALTLK
jgi:hypothetical protein